MDTNNNTNKPTGTFYDGFTGETIERELTDEEIASIVQPDTGPIYGAE
jgi:hypothetical protein